MTKARGIEAILVREDVKFLQVDQCVAHDKDISAEERAFPQSATGKRYDPQAARQDIARAVPAVGNEFRPGRESDSPIVAQASRNPADGFRS